MKRVIPYWEKGSDWTREPFFIRRLMSKVPVQATEIPKASLPMYAFLFLLEGEVLVDIEGKSFLCRGGQFLLIQEGVSFSIHYFKDLAGYTGGFVLPYLKDASYPCLSCRGPVLHTFWFDEAAFMGELLDRVAAAYSRGDNGYITRAFDLLLSCLQSPMGGTTHPLVGRFLDMLFDRSAVMDSVSGYATRLGISPSYLNKLVRTQTRHSAMEWVEIARVNWAKSLLKDRSRSIADVSYTIGIEDPSYFTRFFRKYTRLTPSEFRKEAEKLPEVRMDGWY